MVQQMRMQTTASQQQAPQQMVPGGYMAPAVMNPPPYPRQASLPGQVW